MIKPIPKRLVSDFVKDTFDDEKERLDNAEWIIRQFLIWCADKNINLVKGITR